MFFQAFHQAVLQNQELLVCRRFQIESIPLLVEQRFQLLGTVDGVPGNPEIQSIGKQRVELNSKHTALCQKRAVLLDRGQKMCRGFPVRKYHSLAQQSAGLSSADVKYVAELCQLRKRQIRAAAGKPIAQTRSVDKQRNVVLPADAVQLPQLRGGIQGSILRRPGEIKHSGKDHVVVIGISIKCGETAPDGVEEGATEGS